MAKKVTVDSLPAEISKILDEYADSTQENLDIITKRIGQKGVQAVKNSSKAAYNGKTYASGWTSTVFKNRLYTSVVIHNKKQAGLAHLLEHGHAIRNGTGRYGEWEGNIEHILPVEKQLIAEYEKEVIANL